jgi:putative ABC transport system permease protein
MIKNYIKTALRVLLKNKLYAIINIIGLSVAIACGIVAYLNYQFSQSFDSYHVNKDRIYRLNSYKIVNNQREDWAITPMPMAPALKGSIAGVEDYIRIRRADGVFRFNDKVFNETFHFVDKDFFDVFTFPLKYGSKKDLLNPDNIVITSKIAEKYFGNINPVGKQITVSVKDKRFDFLIGGVIKNPPLNSSLYVSILLPMSKFKDMTDADPDNWKTWSHTTFIMLKKNYPVNEVINHLNSYVQITNNSNIDWEVAGFYLDPLPDVAFNSRELRSNILLPNLHPAAIIGPSVIALLILLLACFNFLNTSIAFSGKRLNEIAVRKVLGVKKYQLILQFLGENFILCLLSVLGGIMLAELFVPAYASLWPMLSFPVDFITDWKVILFLFALLLFITVASGVYPAFYISRFESINIFRNKQKLKGTNPLIRILLVFQFSLSITTIIIGFIFYENANFIKNYDMGFEIKKIIIVPVQNKNDYELYKSRIKGNPLISEVSGSRSIVGFGYGITEAKLGGLKTQLDYLNIGENYLESMGLKIISGRSFNRDIETDYENSLLVNQTFMKKYGWNSYDGKTIILKDDNQEKLYHVIGVVKDFNESSVWEKIQPFVLRFSKPSAYQNLIVKYKGSDSKSVYEYLEREWKKLFPFLPFEGTYQSVMLDDAISVSDSISTVMFYVSLLAVIISAMGMFALISLSIAKRTKEIGIRKVLGASVLGIGKLVSKEYILIFILSSIISVFGGYYLAKIFISSIFAYYVEFGILPFLLSIGIVLGIAMLTIGSQMYKAATSNPVDALRYE